MSENQKTWGKIIGGILIMLFIVGKCNQNLQTSTNDTIPSKQYEIGMEYSTVSGAYTCPEEANFDKMIELLEAKNTEGIDAMKWSGEIVAIPKSNVKILDISGARKVKVKILDGIYTNSITYLMVGSLN